MGELFNAVARHDQGVAERWKVRTRENASRELQPADIDFIIGPIFQGTGAITEEQGKAIIALLEPLRVNVEAVRRLRVLVDGAESLNRWRLMPLVTADELRPVYTALGQGVVGKIRFKSPGTGLTYAPFDYLAIANLMAEKKIAVFESKVGMLTLFASSRGYYTSTKNQLIFHEFRNPDKRTALIVHEVTHAIQDWKDVRSRRRFIEADAFIAEAVVTRTQRGSSPQSDPNTAIIEAAAEKVMNGQVDARNQDWNAAYTAVVNLMAEFYDDDEIKEDTKEKIKERDIYARVVSAAEMTYRSAAASMTR
jgi:hypothetical protein